MNKTLKKKEKTNNKGITLIALVITIIVLLILAGVTINLTLGENGIFRTAEQAGRNYTQAQEQELAGIENFENEINNIIAGTGNNGGSGTDTPGVIGSLLKDVAEPGDYVKYDTGIDGIGDNQDGILTFRVLYNDETNGLQIISDKNVENVTLGTNGSDLTAWQASMNDYNNAIAVLNQKAERYATSSPYTIDGRCVGSVPTVGADGKFNAKNTENVGPVKLDFTTTVEGANSMKEADTNYEADQTAMKTAGIYITGEYYWLASRNVDSIFSKYNFSIGYVDSSDDFYKHYYNLCSLDSDGNTNGYSHGIGLRPCISLRSDVKVIGGGDGSSEAQAYELGI